MQLGTPPDDDDAFKQTPELNSCTAFQRDRIGKPCKIFRSKKRTSKGTRNDNDARWPVLTMLRSPHEENGCRWDSAQDLWEQVRIHKEWFRRRFLEHPCSGFYYRIELQDASGKICLCMPRPSRGNDKIFQLQVQMLETMIMMHP